MATEADGLQLRPLDGNYKTCLTRIGLLMEGLGNLLEIPIHFHSNLASGLRCVSGYGALSTHRILTFR
jgi:hypothetical protein